MKTLHVNLTPQSPLRLGFLVAGTALAALVLAPSARSACRRGCDPILENAFLGDDALANNTTGQFNTATGFEALFSNTTGQDNTAAGTFALFPNTTGSGNTANGSGALGSNSSGTNNTAVGTKALNSATTANENTGVGVSALRSDSTGANNTAVGTNALFNNTIGSGNTAIGHFAGINLTTGSNNIDIGNDGVAAEANTIRIGTNGTQTATFVAGIRGVPITEGQAVGVNGSGQLGIKPSSVRYKEAVKPMDTASEVILALRPVTFRYKKELDPKGAPQFGLVAEEVAKVNSDLVVLDDQGKPFTVRYEEVNAMLLNEFLKEHRKVQDLEASAVRQQKQIEALTVGLQKVSAQLELSKAAPQTVANNQ